MLFRTAAALALSFAALPAMAQDYPMEQVDGWYLAQVRPGVCQIVNSLQGTTMLSFIASDDNPGMIVLVDETWKLTQGTNYDVTFSTDGWRSSRTISAPANLSSNGRYTVGALIDIPTSQAIRRAKRLAVRVAPLGIDSQVTLPDGALASLAECMTGN
jgi:hypothetical protein